MSQAAEDSVKACTHPQMKGAALALLTAIARLIPEGQTTTPPITIDDLAVQAKQHGSTARRVRDMLVAAGLVEVHDGGRGKVGSYELVGLDGTRPMTTADLPLLGRPPRRAKPAPASNEPDLFDQPTGVGKNPPRT